jgi:hypothetical protein
MFYMENGRAVSLLRRTEAATVHNPIPQLGIGLLQIIVHDDLVVGTGLLGELELVNGLVQALAQTVYSSENPRLALEHDVSVDPILVSARHTFSLGSSRTQTTLKLLHRRRSQEKESSIKIAVLHLLDTLHLDIQDADALLLGDGLDCLFGCAVVVAAELSWRGIC